jgi:hypothetical protein
VDSTAYSRIGSYATVDEFIISRLHYLINVSITCLMSTIAPGIAGSFMSEEVIFISVPVIKGTSGCLMHCCLFQKC